MSSLEEIRSARLRKIEILKSKGIDPYPASAPRDFALSEVKENFKDFEYGGKEFSVAGRVMAIRGQGAILFAVLFDGTEKMQVIIKKDELPEEVLVHVERIGIITAQRFLNSRAKVENIVTEVQRRIHRKVEGIIPGVAVHNCVGAWQRDLAAGVPDLEESPCIRQAFEMQMVRFRPLALNRRSGRRQGASPCVRQLRIQRIDSRVFKNRRDREVGKKTYDVVNSQSLVSARPQHFGVG